MQFSHCKGLPARLSHALSVINREKGTHTRAKKKDYMQTDTRASILYAHKQGITDTKTLTFAYCAQPFKSKAWVGREIIASVSGTFTFTPLTHCTEW